MYLVFVILFLSVGMLHVYDYRTTTPPQQNIEHQTHWNIILTTMKQVKKKKKIFFFLLFFYSSSLYYHFHNFLIFIVVLVFKYETRSCVVVYTDSFSFFFFLFSFFSQVPDRTIVIYTVLTLLLWIFRNDFPFNL